MKIKKGQKVKASPITGKYVGPATGARIGAKKTKQIIRRHHTLLKRKAQIESEIKNQRKTSEKQSEELREIDTELYSNGGLEKYQQASISGQDPNRGGDSSKILIEWLNEEGVTPGTSADHQLRLLEVGCLSPDNYVSKCGIFTEVERIDLNSQHPLIKEQDFLKMVPPVTDSGKFDVLSLSLVLNYVPEKSDRGKMLELTTLFLRNQERESCFPSLFLVLPAPCVVNSRYFSENRLSEIMEYLGYRLSKRKETSRIMYWLWVFDHDKKKSKKHDSFKKELLNDGKNKNNFCITL